MLTTIDTTQELPDGYFTTIDGTDVAATEADWKPMEEPPAVTDSPNNPATEEELAPEEREVDDEPAADEQVNDSPVTTDGGGKHRSTESGD